MLGIIAGLTPSARQSVMLHALSHLPLMAAEDPAILDHLRVTPFVDTKSGKLAPCGALHDPRYAHKALESGSDSSLQFAMGVAKVSRLLQG